MKRVAIVFVVAVLGPSLALAWLAIRSLRVQQFLIERQQLLLYQGVADSLAKDISGFIAERQREFRRQVEGMIASNGPLEVASEFDERLRQTWPLAEVGFAVSLEGSMLSPSLFGRPEARNFRLQNDRFLCNRESVQVYWNRPTNAARLTKMEGKKEAPRKSGYRYRPQNALPNLTIVLPDSIVEMDPNSKDGPSESGFRELIGDATDGALARFLQNKLNLLIWHRSTREAQVVFGAQLDLARLVDGLRKVVRVDPAMQEEIYVALLDDSGQPAVVSGANSKTNWKRPFVAAEIGELLPHWEAAVYLLDPAKLSQSAKALKLTLGLMIATLLVAIGVGGWLLFTNLRRELMLARQKTDFVSNVSHELKTPLTSIRMFSELLAEGRVSEPAKQKTYLHIIAAEAARLTRLINNVLDFSRLERGEKKYNFQKCDVTEVMRETVEMYRPHLEANGFHFECEWPGSPLFASGDKDAIVQVLVNLLSNAEKYCGDKREVAVQVQADSSSPAAVEVRVLDRGLGVPTGCEEKIFEKFFRAHDSLSSGVQGSGLGLTLARQIARAHGGNVIYEPREGGGSCFTLRLPELIEA